jgi:hypothetical protein
MTKKSDKLKLKLIHTLSKEENIVSFYKKIDITTCSDKNKVYLIQFEIEKNDRTTTSES